MISFIIAGMEVIKGLVDIVKDGDDGHAHHNVELPSDVISGLILFLFPPFFISLRILYHSKGIILFPKIALSDTANQRVGPTVKRKGVRMVVFSTK